MNKFFLKLNRIVFISIHLIAIAGSIAAGSALADYEAGEQANQTGDRNTAFNEFYAAAQKKDERAYGKLASMYLYGLGTEKDYQQAFIWFHMSHLSGDRLGERFRDAASSTMTREEYLKAVDSAEQQRIKQKLGEKPPQQMPPISAKSSYPPAKKSK